MERAKNADSDQTEAPTELKKSENEGNNSSSYNYI